MRTHPAWLFLLVACIPRCALAGESPPDSVAVIAAVEEYHEGFGSNAPARVSAVLGPSFIMFNGGYSGVTEETGRNRVRQWNKEPVTYLLGRVDDRWKLVGYFIRDIANPQ